MASLCLDSNFMTMFSLSVSECLCLCMNVSVSVFFICLFMGQIDPKHLLRDINVWEGL